MKDEIQILGVCWYKEAQWDRLKDIVSDPEVLEDTYEKWKKDAEKTIGELRAKGLHIKKVSVDTEELLSWSNERNRTLNGETRSEYAAFKLQQRESKYNN